MSILKPVIDYLMQSQTIKAPPILSSEQFSRSKDADDRLLAQNLNGAFLIVLAGEHHPEFLQAQALLKKLSASKKWGQWAGFYLNVTQLIAAELKQRCRKDPALKVRLEQLETLLAGRPADQDATAEKIWSVFFPEAVGIRDHEDACTEALRKKRTVTISGLNPDPIQNPAGQILFAANVMLTTPLENADLSAFDQEVITQLDKASQDPQRFWYDHPIPIGVSPESNEILYGLKNFNQAVGVERRRRPESPSRVNFVLSVSVTHSRLQTLAKKYLKQVLAASDQLYHLNIFAFTEADTDDLVEQVLLPIIERCCPVENAVALLSVFGVDGRYGRHYSFLKAIAALWNVLIDPEIKATFKIDLDQVFPQKELIEQTGASAFEHFQTPLWGATGRDSEGQPIELGMIAGALVNQKDIQNGLFTPDVTFPDVRLEPDEYIFYSKLPQALSTVAEMMTHYRSGRAPDGRKTCIQRIHVTGGTNGILVDSLRRFQPFTPSFIGRAEDQAYLLSTLGRPDRLGYVHAAGLIMRHDKEGFAQEAIARAAAGKQIGDYLRILTFSAYAEALPLDIRDIKEITDPFSGCFISMIPITVSILRFSLRVAAFFNEDRSEEAVAFMVAGIPQLQEELSFIQGGPSALEQAYQREQQGWQLFYRSLSAVEQALNAGESWALAVQTDARRIITECAMN